MTTSRALRRASAATAAAVLGLAGAALAVQPAAAATLAVTNTLNAGDGSLRDAIAVANSTSEADTIVFEGVAGAIELLSTIDITAPLTISGPGVDALTITRDGAFDLFRYNNPGAPGDLSVSGVAFAAGEEIGDAGRAFDVNGFDADVSFTSTSFTGFDSDDAGGAVRIGTAGDVALTDVAASENTSSSSGGAFEILTDGDVGISGSAFAGNSAYSGGAVAVLAASGTVSIEATTFDANSAGAGGAVYADEIEGELLVADSVFTSNSAAEAGGALLTVVIEGGVTVSGSAFDGNDAPGGGAFAHLLGEGSGDSTVVDSEFTANAAQTGGGIIVFGESEAASTFSVIGSRFEGNTAAEYGGGVALHRTLLADGGALNVTGSTFTRNEALYGAGVSVVAGEAASSSAPIFNLDSSTFYANAAVADESELDASGLSVYLEIVRGSEAFIVNSTFDEQSDLQPAPGVIAFRELAEGMQDEESQVSVLHSTVVGPAPVLQLFADNGEGEPSAGSLLLSHDILASTTTDPAVSRAELVIVDVAVLGDSPEALLEDGALDAPGLSARSEAAPAAGPALTDEGVTLEWSVVSTEVDPSFVVQGAGNQLETEPQLDALADNGGPTLTRLPAEASPAVNTGDPAVTGAPAVDQRGSARIVETIDVGAVELPAPPPSLAATGGTVNYALLIGGAIVLLLGVAAIVFAALRRRKTPSGGE